MADTPPTNVDTPASPSPTDTAAQHSSPTSNGTIRAFAFSGGGFDTLNQLGVVHALLVGQCKPPDLVVGISGGAVNAVTLAEVLQAGEGPEGKPNPTAQVARFREIFEAVRSFPVEYLQEILPNMFEVDARAPLKPQSLPLMPETEREERKEALSARFGLISVLNDILAIDLPVSRLTRMVRRILEWKRLAEESRFKCWSLRIWHTFMLWCALGFNIPRIARPLTRVLLRSCLPERVRNWLQKKSFGNSGRIVLWLVAKLGYPVPASALDIIRRRVSGRLWQRIVNDPLSVILAFSVWLVVTVPFLILAGILMAGLMAVMTWLFATWPTLITRLLGAWPALLEAWWLDTWPVLKSWSFPIVVTGVVIGAIEWHLFNETTKSSFAKKLLASYDLSADLATPYFLKRYFVRLFDPDYYGKTDLGRVVDKVFDPKATPSERHPESDPAKKVEGNRTSRVKTFEEYAPDRFTENRKSRIHVYPLVADLQTSKIVPVARSAPVVDALLAACANSPFLRPQKVNALLDIEADYDRTSEENGKKIYAIDALNISNDPLFGIFTVLAKLSKYPGFVGARDIHKQQELKIDIYPVTSLTEKPDSPRERIAHKGKQVLTCDEILESLQLRKFQDAEVGRALVDVVNSVLPPRSAYFKIKRDNREFIYIRANTRTIHPEHLEHLDEKVFVARNDQERRDAMAVGVANGCRAALKVLFEKGLADDKTLSKGGLICAKLRKRRVPKQPSLLGSMGNTPPANQIDPPGIPEVCQHCPVFVGEEPWDDSAKSKDASAEDRGKAADATATLLEDWPVWNGAAPAADPKKQKKKTSSSNKGAPGNATPAIPPATFPPLQAAEAQDPAIAVLFSGGVFRGVFQVGVIAALGQFGVKPQVIAGASVGSIMSAMAARITGTKDSQSKNRLIADLAGTFLCIDRLVVTDRFSDFVRRFTLRAASAHFSPMDLDQFFRRFDEAAAKDYSKGARRILAGLERLFYVDPLDVARLSHLIRNGDRRPDALGRIRKHLQHFLDESGIGREMLGAEPLQLLLDHHVLDQVSGRPATFDIFRSGGTLYPDAIALLATATNMTNGELKILGAEKMPDLKEGLLASSAFPGVFRPRWAWELFRDEPHSDQYIDGGVMDNLPIGEVIKYFKDTHPRACMGENNVPHLLLTASLEPEVAELSDDEVQRVASFWWWTSLRARQMKYNKKVADYARVMRDVRQIVRARPNTGNNSDKEKLPQSIEIVCVMPKWLCGTFAFHPMLGFRREKQARSIAHGCAMTQAKLHLVAKQHPDWATGWQFHDPVDDSCVKPPQEKGHEDQVRGINPKQSVSIPGGCRICRAPEVLCPFSEEALRKSYDVAGTTPLKNRIKEISRIYKYCGESETHQAPISDWADKKKYLAQRHR